MLDDWEIRKEEVDYQELDDNIRHLIWYDNNNHMMLVRMQLKENK